LDASAGGRSFDYLPNGELAGWRQDVTGAYPGNPVSVQIDANSLGRVTKVTSFRWQKATDSTAACTSTTWQRISIVDATYAYDQPYALTPSGPNTYTSGHLAWAQTPTEVMSYGYTPEGLVSHRDAWLAGVTGSHSVSYAYRADSSILSTQFRSDALAQQYGLQSRYDSAGRSYASTTVRARCSGTCSVQADAIKGAYAANGTLASESWDAGGATVTRQYSAYSGLLKSLTSSRVSGGISTPVIALLRSFVGEKLTSSSDSTTATSYSFAYDRDGRLNLASASGGQGPLREQYGFANSFLTSKDLSTTVSSSASNWNLELQRTTQSGGTTIDTSYTYDPARSQLQQITSAGVITDLFDYDSRKLWLGDCTPHRGESVPCAPPIRYDAYGRLTLISRSGALVESLAYDPGGHISQRSFGGGGELARSYAGDDFTIVQKRNGDLLAYAHLNVSGLRLASLWTARRRPERSRLAASITTAILSEA